MTNVSFNLVRGHKKLTVNASILFGLLGIIFIILSAITLLETMNIKEQIDPINKRIAVLNELQKKYLSTLKDAPTEDDIDDLNDRIRILSNKINLNGQMVNNVLYELETIMPDKAHILEFEYPDHDGFVRILLLTDSEKEMSNVLQRLENNDIINNVVLSGQTRQDEQENIVVADIRFSMQ